LRKQENDTRIENETRKNYRKTLKSIKSAIGLWSNETIIRNIDRFIVEQQEGMDFDTLMKEYEDDIDTFGFTKGCYAIDFSSVDLDDVKALCEFMRRRNKRKNK